MSKNEDKIKDVEFVNINSDVYTEDDFYNQDINPNDALAKSKEDILKSKIKKLELENGRYESDTNLRDLFAKGYSVILIVWLCAVLYIITHNCTNHYHFSDSVLIALLVTSTANVIGMVLIVLKNLFPTNPEK